MKTDLNIEYGIAKGKTVNPINKFGERRCIMCANGYPCICGEEGRYTAHCMNCEWDISMDTFNLKFCKSVEEAKTLWNLLNDRNTIMKTIPKIQKLRNAYIKSLERKS